MLLMQFQIKEGILMDITNWDEWMKVHHVKIYTEEELRRKKLIKSAHKAVGFLRRHEIEILKGMDMLAHASET